jgi:hypothetical protein
MRKGIGCVLMLAASVICFIAIGTLVESAAVAPGASVNLGPVVLALAIAFALYVVGLALLTAISRDDGPRRHLPWRRKGTGR